MKKILIVGAGAMGAAFSIPLVDNGHSVALTEPYNFRLLQKLNSKNKFHPLLKINLPKKLNINKFSSEILNHKWDLIVIAVSSLGINSIGKNLSKVKKKSSILVLTKGLKLDGGSLISMSSLLSKYNKNLNISVLKGPCLAKELAKKVKSSTVVANKNIKNKTPILILTKGLKYDKKKNKILTISELIKISTKNKNISVLKGPCLAKELARKNQTKVIIANKNINIAKKIGKLISTNYYLVDYSTDVIGVEVCSAIKNIYAMVIGAGQSLNKSSSLFQKSLLEMKYLIKYFNGKETTVESLAGVGDLYVSAAGGRNSKMGDYLGKGFTFKSAKKKFMLKDTVEGEQLAREIGPFIFKKINLQKIPLMINLLRSLLKNKKLNLKKL